MKLPPLLLVLMLSAGVVPGAYAQVSAANSAASAAAVENGLRPAFDIVGEMPARWTIEERMEHWRVPGVSIAVIRGGKLLWAKGYGVLQRGRPEKVDADTMFSVGSVSKVAAAGIALRMVDAGILDLDRDVNAYLRRWKVPANDLVAQSPVTLRGLMSHSAGLTVHGFPDFQPGAALPTVFDTLDGRPPAVTAPVRVTYAPGSHWRYSGGGITVEQLLIEDVSGIAFNAAARRYLFEPLGMRRSSYEATIGDKWGNIAKAHGPDGAARALPRGYESMPEIAASGLWTTPSDYARYVIAMIRSYNDREGGFLANATAQQMMTEVGVSPYGLGPQLGGHGVDRIFSHGGSNDSYKAWMEGHLATGDGVVIFTNGENGDGLLKEIRRAVAAAEGWRMGGSITIPAATPSPDMLRAYVGHYRVASPSTIASQRSLAFSLDVKDIEIAMREDRLGVTYRDSEGNKLEDTLISEGGSWFVEADDGVEQVEFVRGYDGKVSGLVIHNDDYSMDAQLIR